MNRKEISGLTKIYALSFLCAIPIIILLDILISKYVSTTVLTVIDVILLLLSAVVGYIIAEKRKQKIARKREEFLANKQKENTKE